MRIGSFVMFARFVLLMGLLVGCAPKPTRPPPDLAPRQLALRERFLSELDGMQLERLYALDPNGAYPSEPAPGVSYFRGFPVVREAEPVAEDRRRGRAHRGLRNVIEATSAVASACFEPGQGAMFRGSHEVFDVLVCFACDNYRIHGQSEDDVVNDSFEAADAGPWFRAFEAAGLRKASP